MKDKTLTGHLLCLITIFFWGTTFISTKILLQDFTPVEILFFRFLLGLAALFAVCPRRLKNTTLKQELYFAGAALSGVTLYYLMENIALTYSTASNVGIIVSAAPFFTALLSHITGRGEKFTLSFFAGFLCAMTGIGLISFQGSMSLQINPLGDFLALTAAFLWAVYSLFMKTIGSYGYSTLIVTRRIFQYGILFMIPALLFLPFSPNIRRFSNPVYLGNILFLGIGACAVCFVTWNYALRILGPIKTSVYIYGVPVITLFASALVLHERMTFVTIAGAILTLLGLCISENRIPFLYSQK